MHEIVWQEISFVDFFQLEHLWISVEMNSKFAVCPFYSKPRLKWIGSWLETNVIDFCHFTHTAFKLQLRWMGSWLKTTVIDVYRPDYSTFDIQLIFIWSGLELKFLISVSYTICLRILAQKDGKPSFWFPSDFTPCPRISVRLDKKMFGYCYWFRISVQILMKLNGEHFLLILISRFNLILNVGSYTLEID